MLCDHCKRNEATKVYELVEKGARKTRHYCMECFIRLHENTAMAESEETLSACPYCGATLETILQQKLVGCAYCYREFATQLKPVISKMQRSTKPHIGKRPPTDGAFFAKGATVTRLEKQCYELNLIAQKLTAEKDFEGADSYAYKLYRMREESAVEEDFVWRANLKRSEQP